MNRLCSRVTACITSLSCLLSGCSAKTTYSVRTTVEVITPEGLRWGSSVARFTFWEPGLIAFDTSYNSKRCGSSVDVALPKGQHLFALPYDRKGREIELAVQPREADQIELVGDRRPVMVWFSDLNQPSTAHWADPDHLDLTFGYGVSLKSVSLKRVHEEPTLGISKTLTWLPAVASTHKNLSGTRFIEDNTAAGSLDAGAFEFCKH